MYVLTQKVLQSFSQSLEFTKVRNFLKQNTIVFFHHMKPFAIKMCKMLENHTQTPATCHNHQFQSVEIESLHVSEAQSNYKFSLVVWLFGIASELPTRENVVVSPACTPHQLVMLERTVADIEKRSSLFLHILDNRGIFWPFNSFWGRREQYIGRGWKGLLPLTHQTQMQGKVKLLQTVHWFSGTREQNVDKFHLFNSSAAILNGKNALLIS